jgi:hypothetical protein
MEVKFDKNTKSDVFHNITQKLVIQIWNQYWQDQKLNLETLGPDALIENECTNFVLTDFRIISIDVGIALQIEEDLDTSVNSSSTSSVRQSKNINTKMSTKKERPIQQKMNSLQALPAD